ncbi:CAP domain-containing protein [Sordaria brevicollis]|uniref:CAP domain-containing protein n=1 Tax=Sordaria brevicollis TaxID=83679 RepID=A0AAE0UA66_SORBR|nr:CAP domain-containing protein [Sordaria brevicollis]
MKSSLIIAASGALMASASPVLQDRRLHITTKVVEEWVTVTVTAGDVPFVTANAFHQHGPGRPMYTAPRPQEPSTTAVPTTSQAPAPAPEPSSSSVVVVAPPPAPETTSSTVIFVPVSSSTKQPEPEPTTAPVVVAPPPATTSAQQEPAATTKVDAPAAPASSNYADTLLYHHNIHRSNHSAGALSWGETYAKYAQQAAAACKFQHDLSPGGGGYGQNIAMWGSTNKQTVQDVGSVKAGAQATTNMWYNGELPLWPASDYGKENPDMSNFEGWGHFSQLVWKETQELGCYTQFCPAGTMNPQMDVWYTVCNYYPAGNMGGGYGKNVAPPLQQARVVA